MSAFEGLGTLTPRTIIEPFRVKVVEALPQPTAARRTEALALADWNLC